MTKYNLKSSLILISGIFLFNLTALNYSLAQENYEGIVFANHKVLPGYGFKKAKHPEFFQGNTKKKIISRVGISKWYLPMEIKY